MLCQCKTFKNIAIFSAFFLVIIVILNYQRNSCNYHPKESYLYYNSSVVIIKNYINLYFAGRLFLINIKFLPSEKSIIADKGCLISDAAVLAGVSDLHLPCAGKGTCLQCLTEVISGEYHEKKSALEISGNLVLACQTELLSDSVIRILERDDSIQALNNSHNLVDSKLMPKEINTGFECIAVSVPSANSHYSDYQRLKSVLGNYENLIISPFALRQLSRSLRVNDGQINVVIKKDFSTNVIVYISSDEVRYYGLAVDIGTTTVAVQLVDMITGIVAGSVSGYNNQITRGADVISRIDYIKNSDEKSLEMQALIMESINDLIAQLLRNASIDKNQILSVKVAGNTTMYHLLLALYPAYIREYPYSPTVNELDDSYAKWVGLDINPYASVSFISGVGSYVGGDITSGLLCCDIPYDNEKISLFIDIGTNGEMVVGNSDWMISCACSAGPAFEGSGIKCGMRASLGAIEYISISEGGKDISYRTIGEGKPIGICGSGLISLLGQMLTNGVIDQMGKINNNLSKERIVESGHNHGYILEFAENTANGEDIVIWETDIENIMRTKAAIYSAASLILENVGIDWSMIEDIYIAGGFGRFIELDHAVVIGLLPDLPREKFKYIGNSSLTGAYMSLVSLEKNNMCKKIAQTMTYVDLSSEPKYMDSYIAALFLPHTDINQFPSVKSLIKQEI